jgi:hypothetical protein
MLLQMLVLSVADAYRLNQAIGKKPHLQIDAAWHAENSKNVATLLLHGETV